MDDILPLQVRYTYIDYKYAGSNSFFESSTGAPTLIKGLTLAQQLLSVQHKISVSVLDANTRVLQPKFSSL
ncbi:MAG: hypothetical protein DSZ04_07580 [Sulfurimonas sp.]|nr:MAG: hypothetical protein DSZ04_07580 [Sulfurimonas sp.]